KWFSTELITSKRSSKWPLLEEALWLWVQAYNSLGNSTIKIKEFTLLDAFKLTKKAWENVTEKTIKNCWKST
ncbi:21850_t:CDS:2, partial [Cetraspora pellucida]